jgi:LmbE family N-acetylglucosaminyl deacetylase
MDVIRAFRPDTVLCHWIDDFLHPDHVEAAQAVLWAARYCHAPGIKTAEHGPCASPEFVCYETQLGASPVTKFLPDFYVDVDRTMDRKISAMKALAAQPALPAQYEVLARYRAFEAQITAAMTCTFAEGFCRIGKEAG